MPLIVFRLKGIHIRTLKFYSQASFNNLLREAIRLRISRRDYKKTPFPPLPLLQIACLQMLPQLHCRGQPAVKFYNSIFYLGGGGGQLGHCLYSVLNFFCELVMGENICNQSTVSCFNCCQFASRKQHFIGLKKEKNLWCNFTNYDNNLKYAL